MNPHSLPDLAVFDPPRLAGARRQMISAVLWPARVAASFAAKADAPSPALTWNSDRQAVTTPPFEQALQLELRLPMLHMQFLEHGRPAPHVLDMDDRSPAHVEAWILVELLHRGVDRERFSKALPFEVQNAMWGDHEKFSTADYEAEIAALSQWLVAGADVLSEVAPGMAITVQPQTLSLSAPMTLKRGDGSSEPRQVVFSLGDGGDGRASVRGDARDQRHGDAFTSGNGTGSKPGASGGHELGCYRKSAGRWQQRSRCCVRPLVVGGHTRPPRLALVAAVGIGGYGDASALFETDAPVLGRAAISLVRARRRGVRWKASEP